MNNHEQNQDTSAQAQSTQVIFAPSANFEPSLRTKIFAENFISAFTLLLEKHCATGAALPRADAAYLLGLTPKLTILTDKEEKTIRARCEQDYKTSLAKHGIDKKLRELYPNKDLAKDVHKFQVSFILEHDKLTEEQKSGFEEDCERTKFDQFNDYRTLRNANLELEGMIGLVINEGIIPGYGLQKGPGGGICKVGTTRPSVQKAGPSAPKPPKFPPNFLETLDIALNGQKDKNDKWLWEPLLPLRTSDTAPTYVKRSVITQRMSAIYFGITQERDGKGVITFQGSEFENFLSAALAHNVIEGFDSERGVGKGIYRLAPNEVKKPKTSAKKEEEPAPAPERSSANVEPSGQAASAGSGVDSTASSEGAETTQSNESNGAQTDGNALVAPEPGLASDVAKPNDDGDVNTTEFAQVSSVETDGDSESNHHDTDAEIAAEVDAATAPPSGELAGPPVAEVTNELAAASNKSRTKVIGRRRK